METNLIELWANMNGLVRVVVVILALQALASLTVVVDRALMLLGGYRASRRFARVAGPKLAAGDFAAVAELAEDEAHRRSHLAQLIAAGVTTYLKRRREGDEEAKAIELARRALERKGESLSESLHRGLNVLATTGSTAPFIGLLGTVLGILNAFRLLGEEGAGGIGTIGVAIAEALVVTGFGLMVAIPAVLFFNFLTARLSTYEGILANARGELIDRFETSGAGARPHPERTDAAPAPIRAKADVVRAAGAL